MVKKAVPQAAKIYEKQLMQEINEDREDTKKSRLTDRERPRKRKYPNLRLTPKAEYSTRENIRSALHIRCRQATIRMDM